MCWSFQHDCEQADAANSRLQWANLTLPTKFHLTFCSARARQVAKIEQENLRTGTSWRAFFQYLENPNPLNKEVRPFFLGDNSIWSFPSVSSLSDYSIWKS